MLHPEIEAQVKREDYEREAARVRLVKEFRRTQAHTQPVFWRTLRQRVQTTIARLYPQPVDIRTTQTAKQAC